MNAKELKRYNLILAIGNTAPDDLALVEHFTDLATTCYQTAFEMWEFMLNKHSDAIAYDGTAGVLETQIWDVLYSASESKFKSMFPKSAPLMKLVYSGSATAATGGNLRYLTSLILESKIDVADEVLKLLNANKNPNTDFGGRMKVVLDDVWETYCIKHNAKVPKMNNKQKMMLLEHTLKIKGANKALLSQRIKELG